MDDETLSAAVGERYRRFASVEADHRSPLYAEWSRGIAADDEVSRRIAALPNRKQQANLVFASMRFAGVALEPWPDVRDEVLERWDAITACVLSRSTQTNEPRRLATLLPALSGLPQPLALIEVGASMGLCLSPDRWSYDFGDGEVVGDKAAPRLSTRLTGRTPSSIRVPTVTWRGGLDLNPLDAFDADNVHWLETLIWPVGRGEPDRDRLSRLHAAVRIAQQDRPQIELGDLVDHTEHLVQRAAPHAATTVVFHSAVLAYVEATARQKFQESMLRSDAVWVSNEGLAVLPDAAATVQDAGVGDFVIAVEGEPVALADPHGSWVRVLEPVATR